MCGCGSKRVDGDRVGAEGPLVIFYFAKGENLSLFKRARGGTTSRCVAEAEPGVKSSREGDTCGQAEIKSVYSISHNHLIDNEFIGLIKGTAVIPIDPGV
ncbi:MAG TPA: hypothetical protein DEH22_11720 [Chloroflexi bacterium]|nr:hypothetical protein [Chloroflexota bacterium]